MNSGWARHVGDKAKYVGKDAGGVMHFPGIDPDATAWLLKQRKVAGLAVDTLSLDHGASKDFKTHVLWLGAGRWGLENVAEPRRRAGGRRDAGGRAGEGQRRDRRTGAAVRVGVSASAQKREAPGRDRHRGFRRYKALNSSATA